MKQRQKFFPKEYEKIFNKYLLWWCLSIFLLGSFISLFSIPINGVWFFDVIGKITPGIEKWTDATKQKDIAKAIWIYMTYSSFLILPRMIYLNKKVYINNAFAFFMIIVPLTYFVAVFFLFGSFFDNEIHMIPETNERMLLYRESEIGCILISSLVGSAFVSLSLMLFLSIIELFNIKGLLKGK